MSLQGMGWDRVVIQYLTLNQIVSFNVYHNIIHGRYLGVLEQAQWRSSLTLTEEASQISSRTPWMRRKSRFLEENKRYQNFLSLNWKCKCWATSLTGSLFFHPKGMTKDSRNEVELKAVEIRQISYQLNHNKVIVPSQLTGSLRHCRGCGRSPFCTFWRAILQHEKEVIHITNNT